MDATAIPSQNSKTELFHSDSANAGKLTTTFWNSSTNQAEEHTHLFMRKKHIGIGGPTHNSGNITDSEELCCILPNTELLKNVTVGPPVVGNASWACDFFKIGSGNQSQSGNGPGTDFIYENPFSLQKDPTQFKLISKEHISTIEVDGREILTPNFLRY